jgi:hypothetical protein
LLRSAQAEHLGYIQWMRKDKATGSELAVGPNPPGFTAIGVFLFFGAVMASLAATTLLWRGTVLGRVWALNPTAYKQLAPLGAEVGLLFLALGVALITAGIGWFRRRLWGWRLAVAIIGMQVLGDIVNCVRGDWLRGGTGVVIAGALLVYLLRAKVRAAFG